MAGAAPEILNMGISANALLVNKAIDKHRAFFIFCILGYKNVKIVHADLSKPLLELEEHSCDLVVIANILHEISVPDKLLANAYRLLKPEGKILVVEWKKEGTPFGPAIDRRISQQQLEVMLMRAGLRKEQDLEADGYHYAVLFKR